MTVRVLMTLDAVGGVWRYAMDLGAALRMAGHEIVFAGLGPAPSSAQRQEAAAIAPLEWGEAPLDWMAGSPGDLKAVPRWLEALTCRHRPDLLHLNLPSQAAGLRGGPPRVVVTHSCLATWFRMMEGTAPPPHLAWQAELTAEGLHDAHCVVAPSAAHAALTREVHGLDTVHAVPNACRTPLGQPDAGDGRTIAAARWWDKAKNGTLLDLAADLTAWPVEMLGACEGPGGEAFRPRHARAGGRLSHAHAMARLAAASLFVSPSRYEPFGLAALEAARAARPLLLADIPVYRELWDGAARFFDPRDAADLARGIDDLMCVPDQRRALGAAARERARRYTLARQARAMERIYAEITEDAAMDLTP